MTWCNDRRKHEREGEAAARFGHRYDSEHTDRMRNAEWERESCDASYARGYEREIRRREDERREEEAREREAERLEWEAAQRSIELEWVSEREGEGDA